MMLSRSLKPEQCALERGIDQWLRTICNMRADFWKAGDPSFCYTVVICIVCNEYAAHSRELMYSVLRLDILQW